MSHCCCRINGNRIEVHGSSDGQIDSVVAKYNSEDGQTQTIPIAITNKSFEGGQDFKGKIVGELLVVVYLKPGHEKYGEIPGPIWASMTPK
jgi:hypothetical protein